MAPLKLALKNIRRNISYAAGLFAVFFAVAVMCAAFFMFSAAAQDSYDGLLAKQVSSSYVSINFPSFTIFGADGQSYTEKYDITEEYLQKIRDIDGVNSVYHFCYNYTSCNVSVGGAAGVAVPLTVILFGGTDMADELAEEYEALCGGSMLACGTRVKGVEGGCLVSEAFAAYVGAGSAEELVGKTLSTYLTAFTVYEAEDGSYAVDTAERQYLNDLVITGVVKDDISGISFMEDYGKYFVFADTSEISYEDDFTNSYLIYGGYSDLDGIKEAVDGLDIPGAGSAHLGNDSYAMRKLSQTAQFISAILAVISAVCICAGVAAAAGTALLKFRKNRSFYAAAHAVGLSANGLALCFLFEFAIVAIFAFAVALPVAALVLRALGYVLSLYTGLSFTSAFSAGAALYALLPLAASAVLSAVSVRCLAARNG